MRKLVIFGNGLGRALDNEFFNLESALSYAWEDSGVLGDDQKELIWQCLPQELIEVGLETFPSSEAHLDRLQRVLAACDEILKYETSGGEGWLSEAGRVFPDAIRSYLHCAASYFHSGEHQLPSTFVQPLVDWILESRSHIATLNYDQLLYRAFIGTSVFNGYACLLDGFVPNFDSQNLHRFNPSNQSFYLHLHGSPLYFTAGDGNIWKSSLGNLPGLEGHSSSHIVLTHVHHKTSVIGASPVLREYWGRLETAMSESEAIVLFGYAGGDIHLNQSISRNFRDKQVEVVERKKPEYETTDGQAERINYWCKKLGVSHVSCWWHDSILDHAVWDYKR
ncbi:MAG: SIR2 family protein [Pseudomonadota bacterium]